MMLAYYHGPWWPRGGEGGILIAALIYYACIPLCWLIFESPFCDWVWSVFTWPWRALKRLWRWVRSYEIDRSYYKFEPGQKEREP